MVFMKRDILDFSDDTPMYNPQGLPLISITIIDTRKKFILELLTVK